MNIIESAAGEVKVGDNISINYGQKHYGTPFKVLSIEFTKSNKSIKFTKEIGGRIYTDLLNVKTIVHIES